MNVRSSQAVGEQRDPEQRDPEQRDPEQRDPEAELALRSDETSPHQRAFGVVLRMWSALAAPAALLASLVLGTWLAWIRPGHVNMLILGAVYLFIGVPATAILLGAQGALRKAIARRVLRQLDAPVRGALSGAASPAAFQTTRHNASSDGPGATPRGR